MADHADAVATPAQKGTRRGVDSITESPQQKSAAVTEQTASATPQNNGRTQGSHKKMKGGNLKNWLLSIFKELEEVDSLGTKPKLTSKTTTAANKAAKVNHKGTTNLAPVTKTTAASRKKQDFIY